MSLDLIKIIIRLWFTLRMYFVVITSFHYSHSQSGVNLQPGYWLPTALSLVIQVLNLNDYNPVCPFLAKLLVDVGWPYKLAYFPAIFSITVCLEGISPMHRQFPSEISHQI